MSQVRVPPEAALLFLLRKRELSSGVVALLCLLSMTDRSYSYGNCILVTLDCDIAEYGMFVYKHHIHMIHMGALSQSAMLCMPLAQF